MIQPKEATKDGNGHDTRGRAVTWLSVIESFSHGRGELSYPVLIWLTPVVTMTMLTVGTIVTLNAWKVLMALKAA